MRSGVPSHVAAAARPGLRGDGLRRQYRACQLHGRPRPGQLCRRSSGGPAALAAPRVWPDRNRRRGERLRHPNAPRRDQAALGRAATLPALVASVSHGREVCRRLCATYCADHTDGRHTADRDAIGARQGDRHRQPNRALVRDQHGRRHCRLAHGGLLSRCRRRRGAFLSDRCVDQHRDRCHRDRSGRGRCRARRQSNRLHPLFDRRGVQTTSRPTLDAPFSGHSSSRG